MHLVEIFLPLADAQGRPFDPSHYTSLREELVERFGGLTAHSRAPAQGLWEDGGKCARDDIVILEVMTDALDRDYWGALRTRLEQAFAQEVILIRASAVEQL